MEMQMVPVQYFLFVDRLLLCRELSPAKSFIRRAAAGAGSA